MECIFCKIAGKKIPVDFLYEDDDILAFNDIKPMAPVHILIIPQKHFNTINDIADEEAMVLGKMIIVAKNLAKKYRIADNGYKLLFRVGRNGGQEVSHVHLHLIGGASLSEDIHSI